ncbi:hypothetical protein C8F04DRAFT_1201294 [Mycena alexandri]|uniref:Uncharacterized protein n=1 Tax=Mycena alexandri TaxID=1745969 RepID=A0AAD6S162_9AGAR|nr:hypothetical protein C8F04DRAFT_1201294 [Mycena alexandri]
MPGGRPPLDPSTKEERQRAIRTRYEEKNVEKRRENARLRMQRKRATIASSDYRTQRKYREDAAAASERYRDRKAAEEHAERVRKLKIQKKARKKEADTLHKAALKQAAEQAKSTRQAASSSRKSASRANVRAVPSSNPAQHATEDMSSGDNRPDIQHLHEDNRPLLARRTFTPRKCDECDLDDCPGCACMCMVSMEWIEHVGGHFFPICKACFVDDCPGCNLLPSMPAEYHWAPAPRILLCEPIYEPDTGHEDRFKHTGYFYAVDSLEWKGGSNFRAQGFLQGQAPFARTCWSRFLDLWNQDCNEWHIHAGDIGVFGPSTHTPPNSVFTTDTCGAIRATKMELTELAMMRPPPVPLSPRRAQLQIVRVWGARGAPPPSQARAVTDRSAHGDAPPPPNASNFPNPPPSPKRVHMRASDPPPFHAAAHKPSPQAHEYEGLLYAVEGHSRILQDRDSATALMRLTPGAELFYSRDESAVWAFLEGKSAIDINTSSRFNRCTTESQKFSILYCFYSPWFVAEYFVCFDGESSDRVSSSLLLPPPQCHAPGRLRLLATLYATQAVKYSSHTPRAGKSKATRASDDLRLASLRKSRSLLNAAIDAEFLRREGALADIVKSSGKKAAYIRSLLGSASQFKATRAPTLRNAVVHQRCIDQPEGSNKTLQEIREDLAEDERLGDRLMKQLVEHRKLKRKGIRATTKAQQLDNTKTGICLGNAIGDLFERTGARGIVMLSRGKADDPTVPHIVDSDGASGFFMSAFGVSKVEVIRKFEQYNCSRDDGTDEKNGDIGGARSLKGFLPSRVRHKPRWSISITMFAIREAKGVELAGWPVDIKMADHANWSGGNSPPARWLGAGSLNVASSAPTKAKCEARRSARGKWRGRRRGGSRRREEEEEEDDSDDEEEDDSDKDDDDAAIERPYPCYRCCCNQYSHRTTYLYARCGTYQHIGRSYPSPHRPSPLMGVPIPSSKSFPSTSPVSPTTSAPSGFDFDDPELLEMLADPDAWKSSEGFTLPTGPESRAFAASFSLDNDPTSALISSNANAGGSSKPQYSVAGERQVHPAS